MSIMKRKTTKRKSRSKLPSWNEVRIGLSQVSKLRLLFLLAKIYRSSVVPKSVKSNILSMAKTGVKRVTIKRKVRKTRKTRTAAQKRATRKLVALNKRRRK
jgi:hypothetical protein